MPKQKPKPKRGNTALARPTPAPIEPKEVKFANPENLSGTMVHAERRVVQWRSPLLPPEELQKLRAVDATYADRVVAMAVAEQEMAHAEMTHRHEMEKLAITADIAADERDDARRDRGQRIAAGLLGFGIAGGVIAGIAVGGWAGAALGAAIAAGTTLPMGLNRIMLFRKKLKDHDGEDDD